MKLEITFQTDTHTVRLEGDLDIYNVEAARDALTAILRDGHGLDLDLSGVETCDAAGIQLLAAARRSTLAAERPFFLRTPAPAMLQCGELLGLPPQFWQAHNP
jgi:anti-anti-sigma factor